MPITEPALHVAGLQVSLGGRPVLAGVDLDAEPGAVTAVLGPNGAGKTTLIRCCTGLVAPAAGEIRIAGGAPGSPAALAAVGVMPQSTGAWSGISARGLLRYLAHLYAHPQDPETLIAELGLADFAATPYRRLSGGQQQLVNLAGALVGRPALVFLDEPTAGLDVHARRATWRVIERLRASGVAVVLTTHAMAEAESLADRVLLLHHGRILARGTVAEVAAGGTLEDAFVALTRDGR